MGEKSAEKLQISEKVVIFATYARNLATSSIFDAVDGNVLVDDDGHLYFIDTIIFKSNTGGLEKYNSLSPRASKSK